MASNFEEFMQAAISANHLHNPGVIQQTASSVSGTSLSPFAPVFNPAVPPPNLSREQGLQAYPQSHSANNSQQILMTEGQPLNASMEQRNFQYHPPNAHNFPNNSQAHHQPFYSQNQRGNYHQKNTNNRGRRGQGGFQSYGRGAYENARGRGYSRQFNSGRRPRQQNNPASERHSRNDYGEFLYSHAYMSNNTTNDPKDESTYDPRSTGASDSVGDRGQRAAYVRKVDRYKNRNDFSLPPGEEELEGGMISVDMHSAHEGRSYGRTDQREDHKSRANDGSRYSSHQRNTTRSAPPAQKKSEKKRPENDTAESGDRRVQMEEQLKRGRYECMICCETIRHEAAVWSCQKCYHIFHLYCTKQWAKSSMEGDDCWRCPACQNSNSKRPYGYRCFCGKLKDPKYEPGETPHSCGELCGKKRKELCTHNCVVLCHPGPCPPCNAVVNRSCDCGAEKKSMRCDQSASFKCGKVCGKDLNCGQHQCQAVCHEGDCPPCEITFKQVCYGNHKDREVVCGSEEAVMISFGCQEPCHKALKCGNHLCEDPCHPGSCDDCPLLPDKVTHCCCLQTRLKELDTAPSRTSCLDPVPTCDKICSKPIGCGPPDHPHICQRKCHDGSCGPCQGLTAVTCACGANKKEFICRELEQFTDSNPFKCGKKCKKMRMCGRHKCNELCCTRGFHICEIVCGRLLDCGIHKCEQLCHRGNCSPCLESSFEELTCRCGDVVIYPPVPCGTRPPECYQICTREHSCCHEVRHHCHSDDVCPPCTMLVQKPCMGDHEMRKNVPCYAPEISCGRPCGKPLPCGQHTCNKICHKGPCLSTTQNESCTQPCTKKRQQQCGHPCGAPCHPDTEQCPQTACKAEIMIKCACGNRTAKVQCQAENNLSAEIAQLQRLTMQAVVSGTPGEELDISKLTVQKKNTPRQLECTSTCAQLERNRRLALALEIENPELDAKLNGPKYCDFLKETAKKSAAFIAKVEKQFADLVLSAKQSKQKYRSFAFPAMNRDQRRAVHELAEHYGCETQSYDYEPNKNVVATAYRNKCFMPSATLSATLSRGKGAPPPIPHHASTACVWSKDKPVTALLKEKDKGKEKPDIDYFDFSSK